MKTIKVQESARAFVKKSLDNGDYFAAALLETLPLDEGTLWTFIPDNVDLSDLSLKEGGLSKFDYTENLSQPVVDLINRFLKLSPDNICVIESTSLPAEMLGSWLVPRPKGFKYITTTETTRSATDVNTGEKLQQIGVYGFAMAPDAVREYIEEFVDQTFPFQEIGALTSLGGGEPPISGSLVKTEWLNALASRTQYIFVGAFDGSGWVVWARAGASLASFQAF
jgi:hypothetical protein